MGNLQVEEPPATRLPRATNTRLRKYNQTRPNKQSTSSVAASSSDSSRNSSPGMNQTQLRMYTSTGSPSLRRSLLLAARAPQVPASPSINRRSTLTQPTQASAAKSAPSKNLRSTVNSKTPAKSASLRNSPASTRSATQNTNKAAVSKDVATKKEVTATKHTVKKTVSVKTTAVSTVSQNSNKKPDSRSNSPRLPSKVKDEERSSRGNSSQREAKKPERGDKKPAIQRSDTFLKEEPTVLQKI